jgi:predicted transcriptional regulator
MATIRVSEETHEKARELAEQRGEPMSDVISTAVDRLWRDEFWREANEAWAELRRDPARLRQELDERARWHAIDEWDE